MTYIYCKESFSRPPPAQREFMMLSAMRTMYQYLRPAPPAPLLEPGVKVDVYGKLDHYAFMIGLHLEKPPKRIPSLQAKLPNGRAVVFSAHCKGFIFKKVSIFIAIAGRIGFK